MAGLMRIPEGTLELILVEAVLCLVVTSYLYERTKLQRQNFTWMFGVLAVVSVANFVNYGEFKGHGRIVNYHEQFHFYLGSKYLPEVRYDAIYEAALMAAEEAGIAQPGMMYRDPMTFAKRRMPPPPARQREIRDRFTPERWEAFKHDVQFLFSQRYVLDHGNTGSPAWGAPASLLTRFTRANQGTVTWLSFLDPLLLLILVLAARWAFEGRTAALVVIVALSVPVVYGYLSGSILRTDWLMTLGLSVCFFERRRFGTAGALLGYAVASKLLAGLLVLPVGLRMLIQVVRERRVDRDHLRYVATAVLTMVAVVLVSGLYFGDLGLWPDYARRMVVTFEQQYYPLNHSLRDVFLQARHLPLTVWNAAPEEIVAARSDVFIGDVRGQFMALQLLLLGGLTFVAARHPVRYAFALGPLAVFIVLVTNRYYWQMWLVAPLVLGSSYRRDWRYAGFLVAILGWLGLGHVVELGSKTTKTGGYFGSYGLFVLTVAVIGVELVGWLRERRQARAAGDGHRQEGARATAARGDSLPPPNERSRQ